MLYTLLVKIVSPFLTLINGRAKIYNRENLPQGDYIIVAPHRTWMDPVLIAIAVWPKKFSFMAKKELFKNPLAAKFLRALNAYPVDRKHPDPSAIKQPVKLLRQSDLSTIVFPSGSRYAAKLKGGATLIAKLANVPLVPAVYRVRSRLASFLAGSPGKLPLANRSSLTAKPSWTNTIKPSWKHRCRPLSTSLTSKSTLILNT